MPHGMLESLSENIQNGLKYRIIKTNGLISTFEIVNLSNLEFEILFARGGENL